MGRRADGSRRASLNRATTVGPILILSGPARRDVARILQVSRTTWGASQQLAYESRLDEALGRIVKMPHIGHRSSTLPDTYRLMPVGSHVIVYRLSATTIEIMRILHQRMMPPRHLPPT